MYIRNSLLLAASVLAFPLSGVAATDILLEPSGPIASPRAARDAARLAPKPVRIVVADGEYPMTAALDLGPEDSQTAWIAAPDSQPTFHGGKRITGWKKEGGALWKAVIIDKTWTFEQLWINGRRATLARSPNQGYFHLASACSPGVFKEVKDPEFETFSLNPEHYALLKVAPEAERSRLLLTVTHAWAVSQCRILAMDDATHSIRIAGKARYPFVTFEPDQRWWFENSRAALDAPGEWFLDQARGEIFYHPLPGEDMAAAEAIAPLAEKFLTIRGASGISFKGIRFRYSQYLYPKDGLQDGQAAATVDGCVEMEDSSGIRLEDCEISHTGLHGIYFKNGCSDSLVRHCHLHDLGGGGVRIAETTRPAEERICRGIAVDDSIIQHGGRLHPSACGVLITHAQQCAVTHCDIGDFFYTGVSIGWNWGYGESVGRENRLENCHIHHLGWAYLSDMGGFYGLGNAPGTVIRGNHVHHVASHRYGGWGLYTDEGSGDVLLENNLVHDTSESGFHQHYGYANRIRNNIFAFGRKAQIQRSRNEGRLCFTFEKNIIIWDPASSLLDGGEWNWKFFDKSERGDPKDSLIFRKNLYWPTNGKMPPFLTKSHITWEEWRKMGRDTGSVVEDPLFEDLEARDFRLKPGSPVQKIGFKSWDTEIAGVRRENAAWRRLSTKGHNYPDWAEKALPYPAPAYQVKQHFESTAVGELGIRNASYSRENKGESIRVTDEISSPIPSTDATEKPNKRSLKFQDAPDLKHSYNPVLDIKPSTWESGTFRAGFDLMAQPGANGFFEMRASPGGEFAAGPLVRWQDGKLFAGNTNAAKLTDLKSGDWLRIQITATTGTGRWSVNLTRPNGNTETHPDLSCKSTWNSASYLLFTCLGTTSTAYFIDNLHLEQFSGGLAP